MLLTSVRNICAISQLALAHWCEQGSCFRSIAHHKRSYVHAVCSHSCRFAKLASVSMSYHNPETMALRLQVISFDVKPANVLLDRSGKDAKLADVGLAKVLEHSQTMTNMVGCHLWLTPCYVIAARLLFLLPPHTVVTLNFLCSKSSTHDQGSLRGHLLPVMDAVTDRLSALTS